PGPLPTHPGDLRRVRPTRCAAGRRRHGALRRPRDRTAGGEDPAWERSRGPRIAPASATASRFAGASRVAHRAGSVSDGPGLAVAYAPGSDGGASVGGEVVEEVLELLLLVVLDALEALDVGLELLDLLLLLVELLQVALVRR